MNCLRSWNLGSVRLITAFIGLASACAFTADTAYYDTSWSYSYDAGLTKSGRPSRENFRDVKRLPNGDILCVGETQDTAETPAILWIRLSASGQASQTKVFSFKDGAGAASLLLAKDGDFVLGGNRNGAPFLLRLDPGLNPTAAIWHYDSIARKSILARPATINSMVELESGNVVAAAGDIFPNNYGLALGNFAAFMEFEGNGVRRTNEWHNPTGYEIAGWSLVKGGTFGYLIGGKQAAFLLDADGVLVSKTEYTVNVAGVGSEKNNVSRLRKLRDGRMIAVGQSYEEDGWTKNQRLNYDAWWTTLSAGGSPDARNVSGVSGRDDFLWDAAQLADGRIAFVGGKGTAADSGVWAFVTDSTGKTIEWQRQYNLPGRDNGSIRKNIYPMALLPTPDSGFVVVGVEGGSNLNDNAFTFKFERKAVPVSVGRVPGLSLTGVQWEGRTFRFDSPASGEAVLDLYGLDGSLSARFSLEGADATGRITVPEARCKGGLYFWRARLGRTLLSGKTIF